MGRCRKCGPSGWCEAPAAMDYEDFTMSINSSLVYQNNNLEYMYPVSSDKWIESEVPDLTNVEVPWTPVNGCPLEKYILEYKYSSNITFLERPIDRQYLRCKCGWRGSKRYHQTGSPLVVPVYKKHHQGRKKYSQKLDTGSAPFGKGSVWVQATGWGYLRWYPMAKNLFLHNMFAPWYCHTQSQFCGRWAHVSRNEWNREYLRTTYQVA